MPMTTKSPIASPCIQVCNLDEASGQCWGCGRTRAEIAQWTGYTHAQRAALMKTLPQRVDALRRSLHDKLKHPS